MSPLFGAFKLARKGPTANPIDYLRPTGAAGKEASRASKGGMYVISRYTCIIAAILGYVYGEFITLGATSAISTIDALSHCDLLWVGHDLEVTPPVGPTVSSNRY